MSISASDVVIYRSERLTDETDGGGQMTGTVIPNGQINNLWDDISRPLMATGGVSFRKLFLAIRSANTDKGLGGHIIILKDSAAANVSTLLVQTGDHYDERLSAQNNVEQYVVMSTRSPLRPVGTQRAGQTALIVYAERESDAPEIGEVLVLKDSSAEQAVKIVRVDTRPATYTYVASNGDYATFKAFEMTLKITQRLTRDFAGADPAPVANHATDIFKTQTNATARYYGIKPLSLAAQAGEREVRVGSIFSPLVPAATTEQPILDQRPGLLANVIQPIGGSRTTNLGTRNGDAFLTLPTSWVPGSLRLTIGGSVYADDGAGLQLTSGVERLSAGAVVDALKGTLQLSLLSSQSISAAYLPGVAVELMPYTDSVLITAGNRQLTYTDQLAPAPMPGSVRIEFSYLGRWYTITDNGTGVLTGPSVSGSVNYETGSVSFTLPGEPDTGSEIIYTWARSPFMTKIAAPLDAWLMVDLPGIPIAGSAVISWQRNGSNYTATSDSNNDLTGNASGYIIGNRIFMRPSAVPTSAINVVYDRWLSGQQAATINVSAQTSGTLTLNTGVSDIIPGSVSFTLKTSVDVNTTIGGIVTKTRIARDWPIFCDHYNRVTLSNGTQFGTLNPETGVMTIDASELTIDVREYVQVSTGVVRGGGQFETVTKTLRIESQSLSVRYRSNSTSEPATHSQALADTNIETVLDAAQPFVPGSIVLTLGGTELVDRRDGYLYRSFNAATAAGLQTGQIDYSGGRAVIPVASIAADLSNLNGQLVCAAIGIGAAAAVNSVVFRSVASPLRPSGLQFLARRAADTALMRAESVNDGSIAGSFDTGDVLGQLPQMGGINGYTLPIVPEPANAGTASGSVNYETGVVRITFSQPVILSTLTYNAVSYTTIPLDPTVLGLNPVKLPTNGTVPVFQPGYLAVVHNTESVPLATPTAAQVIDCGRTNLAVITIRDATGADLDPAMYVADRAMGTVTLADPFLAQDSQGNSLTMPLTLSHRVEDVVSLGAVGVDGVLQLLTELTHDYPANNSYISAAVYIGTMQARIKNLHDRQTDNDTFSDTNGTEAVASYDSVNFPILIDNRSAVKERWKLKFTSSTNFQCIGEKRGVIGTGTINADFSPINPFTGQPYFTIKQQGWGGGWVTSNVLRFDTDPAAGPVWAIRTVLPSSGAAPEDATIFEGRVEAD